MSDRRARYKEAHAAAGRCLNCASKALPTGGLCLWCNAKRTLKRNGLWGRYLAKYPRRQAKLSAALAGRYAAVLLTEGFAISAVESTHAFVARAARDWARPGSRQEKKLGRLVSAMDDRAIRYRMRGIAAESVH